MSGLALTLTFDGHRVRMVGTPERPEWVAKDVCRVLGIHSSRSALRDIVPESEKGVRQAHSLGGPQDMATVTEGGLYRLISRSRKPEAVRFQDWLFNEVLPCIRRFGAYPAPAAVSPAPVNALSVFEAAVAALREQAERTARLEAAQAEQSTRIARIEARAEVAETELRALPPATVTAPEKSARAALNERVRAWGIANGGAFREAWNKVKRELYYRSSFDADARARHQGIPWLDVVEREGQMPTLYAIAAEVLQ